MNLPHHPRNIIFLTGLIVYVLIRHRFIELTRQNDTALTRVDLVDTALIGIVALKNLAAVPALGQPI